MVRVPKYFEHTPRETQAEQAKKKIAKRSQAKKKVFCIDRYNLLLHPIKKHEISLLCWHAGAL